MEKERSEKNEATRKKSSKQRRRRRFDGNEVERKTFARR
jgi:hypothetical protein